MRRYFRIPLFLTALCVLATALYADRTFPQATSDLPADQSVRFGVLPNGMHYVIMQNSEPQGRVAVRLMIEAGAFMEEENQRGVAHFLEHMAFNGTKHYPPGTLIKFFQRMGMNFGGDTNAYTSFDHTVYMLDLPDTKEETLAEGFQVFADYADGMLLQEKEIEAERGIILSEKRTRDNVGFRTFVAEAEVVYAGTRIPTRLPIGLETIIKGAPAERFVHFYDIWYRPDLMTVIVVGDADPDLIQTKLVAAMGPLVDRAPAVPSPELGQVSPFKGTRVNYHPEAEAAATSVSIQAVSPYQIEPDTAANRLKYLPRSMAISMLNRRLSILAKEENAGFTSARASANESFNLIREISIEVSAKPDQWQNALRVADHELRRALEHGFQAAELKETVANYLNGLEQAVKTASTRRSSGLASQIIGSLMGRHVFTTPATNLALFAPALAQMTPEDCLAALREAWGDHGRYVLVNGNVVIPGDAKVSIAAAYAAAHQEPVAPPAKIVDEVFAYTDFGPAGKIVERSEVKDLGLTLVTFANGVRLNLKPTDFEANRIHINLRIGTGQLTEPADQPGLSFVANSIFISGGLSRHSADDLRRILAGRTVGVGFGVRGDAFNFNGSTNRDDLLLEFQLMAAHLTDPGYRPESMRQLEKGLEQMFNSFAHTSGGALNTEVPLLLASGDPRFGIPPKAVLLSRTADEVSAWLKPQLASGATEIGIVGDFDVDAAINVVARTIGALPTRDPRPELADRRQVKIPTEPFTRHFTFISEIPKGVIALYWPTADASDVHRTRRLSLLGGVLSERLRVKVREEIGGAYSPGAGNSSSDVYDGYGWMQASITVDPDKAEEIGDVTTALANDLATSGITADELERVRLPVLTSIRESERTNGYWLGSVVNRAQEKPEVLDWARSRRTDNEAVTTAELDDLAKSYLGADRVFRVTVLPDQK